MSEDVPVIAVAGLNKWFGATHVLRDIDLTVERGETLVLCGPSGSGKSTLIRCLNGLEPHQAGTVRVAGTILDGSPRTLAAVRAQVGMVFQSFNLFSHLTVLENCTLAPIHARRMGRRAAEARAMGELERVRVAEQAHKHPGQLSGGQQQRVAIARALCLDPTVLLFDEPTSALDPEMVGEVLDAMTTLAQGGTTMLCVTHEMGFARQVASRVVFLDEGQIVEIAPPAQFFEAPRHPRTKSFLERVL